MMQAIERYAKGTQAESDIAGKRYLGISLLSGDFLTFHHKRR